MKLILQILMVFSFISVQAQYTLTDDDGNPIADGATVIANYDIYEFYSEAEFDCNVLSENSNDIRFEIVSTNQGENATNWFCTNFGLCYLPTVTDQQVELLADNTRELQLHYNPNGHTEDATVYYRITEVGNTSNTISFSVKYVGVLTSIIEKFSSINKVEVYPNPANQFSKIAYDVKGDSKVILYNILGEKIETYVLNKGSDIIVINTSELKSGTYIYKFISQSKEVETKYLIVNH